MAPKSPNGKNLRKGRWSANNQIYVITFVTNERMPWLKELIACRSLIRTINCQRETETLAYVIMPDHVHWLMRLKGSTSLARVVHGVKSASAHRLNVIIGRKGRFWQPGYHDHAIRHVGALRDIARYVVANPIRAGLVRQIGDYPYWDATWL